VRHFGTESTLWLGRDLTRPSTLAGTLTDTRPPRPTCFEVEKHALRLGASAHYLPTNLGPSPLRKVSL
jgi:hypothetical protein